MKIPMVTLTLLSAAVAMFPIEGEAALNDRTLRHHGKGKGKGHVKHSRHAGHPGGKGKGHVKHSRHAGHPGGKGKGGKGKGKANTCEDDPATTLTPSSYCDIFWTFDNVARSSHTSTRRELGNIDWAGSCDEFNPMDKYLCPDDDEVAAICAQDDPSTNGAVRRAYCAPLLEGICDADRRDDCERWCTNYVSQAKGDCCDFQCP